MNTYFTTLNNRVADNLLTARNRSRFNALIDEVLSDAFSSEKTINKPGFSFTPPVNIMEDATVLEVELAVPGYDKSDIKIDVDKKVLTISSTRKQNNDAKAESYSRREFTFKPFKQSFNLPESINRDEITANYSNGILTVRLLKNEDTTDSTRRIDIQ